MGDYEHGFGTGGDDDAFPLFSMISFEGVLSNSHNPILWGGIDTGPSGTGPFTAPAFSRVLASPFPRSSRMGGGLRSAFTSGVIPDGEIFSDVNPHSLSSATLTGIVLTHAGRYPEPQINDAGAMRTPSSGESHGGKHCGHAFTIGLTPVGDFYDTPKDGGGSFVSVDPTTPPVSGDARVAILGRRLQNFEDISREYDHTPAARKFKVGNWLDHILDRYGIAAPSGSMLPPGARIFLEISTGTGPGGHIPPHPVTDDRSASGCWVGGIQCAFEVETADGTAMTTNVNFLGEDGS
jgi:hypothetical protein